MQIQYNFHNKNVLVTGGASGLGFAIVRQFAISGANVIIADLNIAEGIIDKIGDVEGKIITFNLDVTDAKAIANVIEAIELEVGTVDILINNASIYPVSNFLSLTENEWDQMIEIDLKSVFLCTKAVSNLMIKNNTKGSIINIGSIDALHPSNGHSHYCSAKAGVLSYTISSAYELGPYGIRVNTISPGLVDRPALKEQWADGYMRFINKSPLERVPSPEDIAYACMFLASDGAKCITGIELPVDSGVLCAPPY